MPNPTPRLTPVLPSEMDPDQLALYEAITGGPRATGPQLFELTDSRGSLTGPFNAMLLSPAVGHALQGLGAAIRYATGLSPRVREMAILAVAAHWDCAFELHAHEAVGRHVGLTETEIAALRNGTAIDLQDPVEAAALVCVRILLSRADLNDQEYERARTDLGEQRLFEISALVGYYATLALQLRLFRVKAPSS